MDDIITKVLPGFMELLPEEQIEFDRIKGIIAETFARFGFTAIDTPAIERSKTLLAKAGGETEKQIYQVANKSGGAEGKKSGGADESAGAELSLRFDLTVPLARYVAEHFNELSFPFRRCHIAKVYRGERPQRGRYREFYQCDIDVVGKDKLNIRYDAEMPSIIYQVFKELDFGKFTIRINNRKLLGGLIGSLGADVDTAGVLRAIDKAEKIPPEAFAALLGEQGLSDELSAVLRKFIGIKGDVSEVLSQLRALDIENEMFLSGVSELETVAGLMTEMGVAPGYFAIDVSIARGLDYYTGTVYETTLDDYPGLGSVCSGGRYDDLASYYTEQRLPGVGISIGLTRLFYKLRELGLIDCTRKTAADVVIVPMDDSNIAASLKTAHSLRAEGLRVDLLLEDLTVKKKFQYVSRKDPQFTAVIGSEEEESGFVTLQFRRGGQIVKEKRPTEALAEFIKAQKCGMEK